MGWLPVLISTIAAILMFKTHHTSLTVTAAIVTFGCFWSWGVMHNYASELAKRRPGSTAKLYDITEREAHSVPNWITTLNMVFSLAGLTLLILGIVFYIA